MFFKRLEYKISKFLGTVFRRFRSLDINWSYSIFSLICILSIVLLGANIFRTIRKGYERYEIIQGEKRRLAELEAENVQLEEELKYYASKEFVDIAAREELGLAFPNQKLIYIEEENSIDIKEKTDPEKKATPSWKNWYDLIF